MGTGIPSFFFVISSYLSFCIWKCRFFWDRWNNFVSWLVLKNFCFFCVIWYSLDIWYEFFGSLFILCYFSSMVSFILFWGFCRGQLRGRDGWSFQLFIQMFDYGDKYFETGLYCHVLVGLRCGNFYWNFFLVSFFKISFDFG